jgi:hypothetical protein
VRKPRALSVARSQAFCRAIAEQGQGRRVPFWVSIGDVARQMGIAVEAALELTIQCERENLVTHDPASFEGAKNARGRELVPHSVSLIGRGHDLASRPPRR